MKQYGKLDLRNCDCMELMEEYEDNHFELAIVDPPYGKKPTRDVKGMGGFNSSKNYDNKANIWDIRPSSDYFIELKRISKNQIVWGANYFIEDLSSSNAWVAWDKNNGDNIFADFELAYTSFSSRARIFRKTVDKINRFHPTQKPVKLYRWLLQNYAKYGDKILDTHLGSGSIAIACYYMGFDLVGSELDEDYYKAMMERIDRETREQELF